MNRPALLFFAFLLAACGTTPEKPQPAPVLTLTRTDAHHVAATISPAPASGRWSLALSAECGAEDGPAIGGNWPSSGPLVLVAGRGDMLKTTFYFLDGSEFIVSDCVPPFAENSTTAIGQKHPQEGR